jgi:chromate transporter
VSPEISSQKGRRESRVRILFKLFYSCLYISAFTFGGGFVIVSLMKKRFVDEYGWMEESEMLDFAALAQSSPGAIAVNAAILVGWKVCGLLGMLIGVLGMIIPPMAILSVISFFYAIFAENLYVGLVLKGLQAGVAAVIMDVVCGLGVKVLKEKSWLSTAVMLVAFVLAFFCNVNVILLVIAGIVLGILRAVVSARAKKEGKA